MTSLKNMFKFLKHTPFSDWNRNDEKLLKAVENMDITKVYSILSKKVVSTTKCGPKGYGAIHYACVKGLSEFVELFINQGADVDVCNERGNSPLHLASHNAFPEVISKLLMAGATVDMENPYQMTALHIACNSRSEPIVQILVEYKADVNARDKTQKTPLFFSCYQGHFKICKFLVERGALVNVEDISKVTPLMTAVRQNHIDIVKFLIKNGADPHIQDRYGESAFQKGQESTSREMKRIFSNLHSESPDTRSSGVSSIPVESPDARSSASGETLQQRESVGLSVQVLDNLSFGDDFFSEMGAVQLRNTPGRSGANNEVRPRSAPPPPPPRLKRNLTKSTSEDMHDWEVVDGVQKSQENLEKRESTKSLASVTENNEDKELDSSVSVIYSEEEIQESLPPSLEFVVRSISDTESLSEKPQLITTSEIMPDWEQTNNSQQDSENADKTDSFYSASENTENKQPSDNISPSNNMDVSDTSFLGLSLEEHRSCLSELSKSDISSVWDQPKDEDVISIASQRSDQIRLDNYGQDFSFIPGNATPKTGSSSSLRRQILTLRQENNQLRESGHDNLDRIKDQEEEIKRLKNLLEEKKDTDLSIEKSKTLPDDDGNSPKEPSLDIDNSGEDDDNFDEKVSKLIQDNEEALRSLELPDQNLGHEKVGSILQENLTMMQRVKQQFKKMNSDIANYVVEPKEDPEEIPEIPDQQDDIQEIEEPKIQELKDLQEEHLNLQNNYHNVVSTRDNLQEEFDKMKEERDRLLTNYQRLKQDNEQATKQNCNLLNMKDNLKQELDETVEQKQDLQEKYDLLSEKTENLEKIVEKFSTPEDEQKLNLSQFDETEDLLEAVEAKEPWEDDKNNQLQVLQLDNSLLEEQCRKLLTEKDILEEENAELKQGQDARVQQLVSEKEELWAEKVKLAEKLEEMIKETYSLQQKNSTLQSEMHLLKCQGEDVQRQIETRVESENVSNSKIQSLENRITKLQQELIQTEKKYKEIVENYRLHLIGAIQGYLDPEVEKALYSIIELRRMEFYC